ncbi:hypothetical protein ACP70R_033052 [Stipagrostis hirtigluma subsp. patula]
MLTVSLIDGDCMRELLEKLFLDGDGHAECQQALQDQARAWPGPGTVAKEPGPSAQGVRIHAAAGRDGLLRHRRSRARDGEARRRGDDRSEAPEAAGGQFLGVAVGAALAILVVA